jgi:hypothetical protein
MIEYSETGEAFFCVICGHHRDDDVQKGDYPSNAFYQAREYLHCRKGCSCTKFIPYQIDVEKVRESGWDVPPELQGKPINPEDREQD